MKSRFRMYCYLLVVGLALIGLTVKAEFAINQFHIEQLRKVR